MHTDVKPLSGDDLAKKVAEKYMTNKTATPEALVNPPSTPLVVVAAQPSEDPFIIPADVMNPSGAPVAPPVEAPKVEDRKEDRKEEPKEDKRLPKDAQEAMAAMRKGKSEADAKLAEALKQIEALKLGHGDSKKIEELQKENEKLSKRDKDITAKLAQYDLMQDPEFISKYKQPMEEKKVEIANTLMSFGLDEESALKLVDTPVTQRLALLKDILPEFAASVIPIFSPYDLMDKKYVEAVKNAQQTRAVLNSDIRQKNTGPMFEEALAKLSKSALLSKSANEAWNQKVDTRIERSKQLAASASLSDIPELAIKAVMAEDYSVIVPQIYKAYSDLKARLDAITASNPSLGQRFGTEPSEKKTNNEPMSPDHLTKALMNKFNK